MATVQRMFMPRERLDLAPFFVLGIVHQATGEISDKWYGQQAVYRLSMGNFVSVCQLKSRQTTTMYLYGMHTIDVLCRYSSA